MTPYSEIIRELLIDLELAEEKSIFAGFMPDDPDSAIGVYDTAGKQDGRVMETGERIDHPGIQITIRGIPYTATWETANSIALALDGVRNVSVAVSSEEAYVVQNVSRSGTVIPVGIDEVKGRRRHLFTINATLTVSVESE